MRPLAGRVRHRHANSRRIAESIIALHKTVLGRIRAPAPPNLQRSQASVGMQRCCGIPGGDTNKITDSKGRLVTFDALSLLAAPALGGVGVLMLLLLSSQAAGWCSGGGGEGVEPWPRCTAGRRRCWWCSGGGGEGVEPVAVGGHGAVVGCCAVFDSGDGAGPGVEAVGGVLEGGACLLARCSQVAGVSGGVGVGEQPVDLAGDVVLEAADGLAAGFALGLATLGVGAGVGVGGEPDHGDAPQGVVG